MQLPFDYTKVPASCKQEQFRFSRPRRTRLHKGGGNDSKSVATPRYIVTITIFIVTGNVPAVKPIPV